MSALPNRLQIPPAVLWTDAGDEVLLLDTAGDGYFRLADVGACLWRSWAADGSVEASIDEVLANYAVTRETVSADAAELIAELSQKGLLRPVDA
jgi:hypothetical protein